MTIELDTTLAQAEVLFLSFTHLIADVERRQAEETIGNSGSALRRRGSGKKVKMNLPEISDNLRDLLQ
jgi:TBC1 domain family member 15